MTSVAYAFVIATMLFFLFRQTRWMGVVGVFVLLAIHPVLFTVLLVLTGAIGYWVHRIRRP